MAPTQRVRYMIERHGPTQEAFGDSLKTDRERVNRWANGSGISLEYAEKIAALDDYPANLFSGETDLQWIGRELTSLREILDPLRPLAAAVPQIARDVDGWAEVLEALVGEAAAHHNDATEDDRPSEQPI